MRVSAASILLVLFAPLARAQAVAPAPAPAPAAPAAGAEPATTTPAAAAGVPVTTTAPAAAGVPATTPAAAAAPAPAAPAVAPAAGVAPGGGAPAAASVVGQVPAVTNVNVPTTGANGMIGNINVLYTQTFASVILQYPSPTSGSIGLGTVQGQVGATKTMSNYAGSNTGGSGGNSIAMGLAMLIGGLL